MGGAGAALTLAYVVELVLVTFLYRARYGFRFAPDVVRLAMIQGVTIFVGLFVALHKAVWVHYAGGGLLFLFSLWYSYLILMRESTYLPRFMAHFSKWFRR